MVMYIVLYNAELTHTVPYIDISFAITKTNDLTQITLFTKLTQYA